jgi:hypothetical protein
MTAKRVRPVYFDARIASLRMRRPGRTLPGGCAMSETGWVRVDPIRRLEIAP